MDNQTKNIKVFRVGRNARKIKKLERKLESMTNIMNIAGETLTYCSDKYSNDYVKLALAMDRLYAQIVRTREEIDELEKGVIEIHIRF